jgi:hypothetical protein
VVLLLAGVILCFIPGPGLPLLFVGAGLLAQESRMFARWMDRTELLIRKLLRWCSQRWQHASKPARYALLLLATSAILGSGYGAYRVMFGQ